MDNYTIFKACRRLVFLSLANLTVANEPTPNLAFLSFGSCMNSKSDRDLVCFSAKLFAHEVDIQ